MKRVCHLSTRSAGGSQGASSRRAEGEQERDTCAVARPWGKNMLGLLPVLSLWILVQAGCDSQTASPTPQVDADADDYPAQVDCDESDSDVHPGADELCNGEDDNCNDLVDELPVDGQEIYPDQDLDGFAADSALSVLSCSVSEAHATQKGDCDDLDPKVYPLNDETCDGRDEDCDFDVDEDAIDLGTWYEDLDGDGFGNAKVVEYGCEAPLGYVADPADCWDFDSQVHPDAAERCNLVDDDCDLVIDEDLPDQDDSGIPDCQEPVILISLGAKTSATSNCENMPAWQREAQQLEFYLIDMGLHPRKIEEDSTNGISASQVPYAPFLIWVNGGVSGLPKAQTVATLAGAAARNQGLLFVGDDMAKQASEYKAQAGDDTLLELTWLASFQDNGRINDGAVVAEPNHPVMDGWDDRVASFGYRDDIDVATLMDAGPTLLMRLEGTTDNPAVWAVDSGQRTVVILPNIYASGARCPVGQSSDLSNLSTLFKNATAWILHWT